METLLTALGLMRLSPLDRSLPQGQTVAGREAEGTEVPGGTGQLREREAPTVGDRVGTWDRRMMAPGGETVPRAARPTELRSRRVGKVHRGVRLPPLLHQQKDTPVPHATLTKNGTSPLVSSKTKEIKRDNQKVHGDNSHEAWPPTPSGQSTCSLYPHGEGEEQGLVRLRAPTTCLLAGTRLAEHLLAGVRLRPPAPRRRQIPAPCCERKGWTVSTRTALYAQKKM